MASTKSKASLARKAIIMEIGGFRPPENPAASWFGKVNLALPGESWPLTQDKPMLALCQLVLDELPFRPPHLEDLAVITIFIGPDELPIDQPNGTGWCLRAYRDISQLVLLEQPKERSPIKSLPMQARQITKDFPALDDATDLGFDIDDEEAYQERYPNADGFKLAGWPTLVQHTIQWPDNGPQNPEFTFQIDSNEKAHWQWGDGGVGYFGRGTAESLDKEWVLTWQCL